MDKQLSNEFRDWLRFWTGSIVTTAAYALLLAWAHRLATQGYAKWVLAAFVLSALCAAVLVCACIVGGEFDGGE